MTVTVDWQGIVLGLLAVVGTLVAFIHTRDIGRLEKANDDVRTAHNALASIVNAHAITIATHATSASDMQKDIAALTQATAAMGDAITRANSKLDVLLGRAGSPPPFPTKR